MSDEKAGRDSNLGDLGLPFPQNHSQLPTFEYLVKFLEAMAVIKGVGSTIKRQMLISEFVRQWRVDVGNDIYPAFQLLLPQIDDTLRQLQVRENALAKLIVSSLHINPQSSDAISLLESKKVFNRYHSHGKATTVSEDLGAKCESAVAKRSARTTFSGWSLNKVYDTVLAFSGAGKEDRLVILSQAIAELCPEEIKWFIRILLRSMNIDCSEKTFLQCFHPNALEVYRVVSSLKLICNQLWDPEISLQKKDTQIRLGSCFKPMRAKFIPGVYSDLGVVVKKMAQGCAPAQVTEGSNNPSFFIEEKVDGERIQLHYIDNGKECRYFSRRGNDYTELYGKSVNSAEGTITPYLRSCISSQTQSCILDGEMVAFDTETNEICSASNVRQTAKVKGTKLRNVFLVFDCLYKNGRDLSTYCLHDRKRVLESVVTGAHDAPVRILPYHLGSTKSDIQVELTHGISEMSEGIVVKNMMSTYILDGRLDSWIKVKPEFINGFVGENFDLVVVGAYKGKGARRNQYSSYLCALRKEDTTFVSLCKVGSGISSAMRQYVDDLLKTHTFSSPTVPEWLTMSESKPDVYVNPQDSVIMEVKATQILTNEFGFSLRFPRFVKLREDKDAKSSMRLSDFLEYKQYLDSKTGVTKRKSSNISGERKQLRAGSTRITRSRISKLFDGYEFYVAADIDEPKFLTVKDFSSLITEHGGRVVAAIGPATIVISDKKTPGVIGYLMTEESPKVVFPKWIFDCIDSSRVLPFESLHYFVGRANASSVDKYGFSLLRKQSRADVQQLLDKMVPMRHSKAALETTLRELFENKGSRSRATLFLGMRVFVQSSDTLTLQLLRYGSATFTADMSEATHILDREPAADPKAISTQHVRSCWTHA